MECTVTAEDDLLIGRLAANFSGGDPRRSLLMRCERDGTLPFAGHPIPAWTGSINLHESVSLMKLAPTITMVARLLAVDESGSEHQIGEYTFNHTRTMPGPAGW